MARVFLFVSQNMFTKKQINKPPNQTTTTETQKRRRVSSKEDRVLLEFLKVSGFPWRGSKSDGGIDWRAAVWLRIG